MASRRIKQVIVMRTDLNMRKGKMIAQGSHASMAFLTKEAQIVEDSFVVQNMENTSLVMEWMKDGFTKVCLQIGSEQELIEICNLALEEGLTVNLITDSGFTEFNGVPTKTCLAIGPNLNEDIDKITSHLKLL